MWLSIIMSAIRLACLLGRECHAPNEVAHPAWLAVDADVQTVPMPCEERGVEEGCALCHASTVRVAEDGGVAVC